MADYREWWVYSATTGLPLVGQTPSIITYVNAETGYTGDTPPTVEEVGSGLYRHEAIPSTHCAVIDFGAGTSPRYEFIEPATETCFMVLSSAGAPLAGLTLSWLSWINRSTGVAITPQPTFTEFGGGVYRIDGLVDEGAGAVDLTAASLEPALGITGTEFDNTYYSGLIDLPVKTLAALRLEVEQRTDMVNTEFITDSEWATMLNGSLYELYDLLIQCYGNNYFATSLELTTDGTATITLPTDFYKSLGVDAKVGGTDQWVSLSRYEFAERNRFQSLGKVSVGAGRALRYQLFGNTLRFDPTPESGQTIRLWYAPKLEQLVYDSDSFNFFSGWSEYVVVDCAIKALQKEESDVSVFAMQKADMKRRIESAAENRDVGQSFRVSDTRGSRQAWGPYSGWRGYR